MATLSSDLCLWSEDESLLLFRSAPGEPSGYHLHFWDQVAAKINLQHNTVSITPLSPEVTPATLEHLLHDQIYPRLLAHEGRLVLHAGAVDIDDKLALFLGESGMGKSTLVASLYQAGAHLLNDDTLIINQAGPDFTGEAIYKGLRLLPDSLASLFPQQTETSPVAHYTSKQRLNVALEARGDSTPKSVGVMFFLAPATDEQTINLRRMSAAETCMGIITNSFSLDPTDTRLAQQKLQQAAALANGVAAFELSYPRDYAVLPQVHARIREQMKACCEPSLASSGTLERI